MANFFMDATKSQYPKPDPEDFYALYQAALVASTKNQDFMLYYARKLEGRQKEKGIQTKMWVKLSAKMLLIAWTLMKKKEAFDPTYLNME